MKKLLVTGANGFIGSALTTELSSHNFEIIASSRNTLFSFPAQVTTINTGNLLPSTDWSSALKNIDIVIHTAARVHVMHDNSSNPLAEFRKTNVDATLNLAQQAASSGVTRFIFISSIKANGQSPKPQHILKPDDPFVPKDPYGLSKYEAEKNLIALAKTTDMEVTIIRPPLVYGPKVKGNFLTLIQCVQHKIPLPLGSINNLRSFIALDNLINFIVYCTENPKAANETFIISDGQDISTTELLKNIAKAFNKKAFLIPVPAAIISFFAKLLGKKDLANRLLESLQVDSTKARTLLDWTPVTSMDAQLKKIAETYLPK